MSIHAVQKINKGGQKYSSSVRGPTPSLRQAYPPPLEIYQYVKHHIIPGKTPSYYGINDNSPVQYWISLAFKTAPSKGCFNTPLEHTPKPFTKRLKRDFFHNWHKGDCLGCALGVCWNNLRTNEHGPTPSCMNLGKRSASSRRMGYKTWDGKKKHWNYTPETWQFAPETWQFAPETWQFAPETWQFAPETWQFAPETWQFAPETWQFAPETWQFAPETWQFAPETWQFAPENRSSQMEIDLPTINFQGLIFSFRVDNLGKVYFGSTHHPGFQSPPALLHLF